MTEFVPSYCSGDPDELTTLTSPDLCGSYDGSGTPDVFSTCRTNAPELTQTFKDLCVYDYCENYLSQGSSDETVSACAIDGNAWAFLYTACTFLAFLLDDPLLLWFEIFEILPSR